MTITTDASASAQPADAAPITAKELRRISFGSLLATSIEWYDFYIYASLAAIAFPHVFFSDQISPALAGVLSFSTMAVGFLSRPLGALLFGRIGDLIGRKIMLVAALVTVGASSLAIGLVPGYASIGIAGAVLLTVFRFIQGLAVGGQWGGAVLLIAERAPQEKRGFYAGIAQQGVPLGLITSGLAVAIITNVLGPKELIAWAWRIPFFIGAGLTVIALFVVLGIENTIERKGLAVKPVAKAQRPSLGSIFRQYPIPLIVGLAAQFGLTTGAYTLGTWTNQYVTDLIPNPVSRADILWPGIVASVVTVAGIFAFSKLSDRIGGKRIMLAGFILAIVLVYPLFLAYQSGNLGWIWVASLVYSIPHSAMFGPLAGLLTRLFPQNVRATGISLSYQTGGTLGGGIAAVVAGAIFLASGKIELVALYVLAAFILGFAGTALAKEKRGTSQSAGELSSEPGAGSVDAPSADEIGVLAARETQGEALVP